MKILLKIPTRGRGLDSLLQWGELADDPQNTELIISVDDDELIQAKDWLNRNIWNLPFIPKNIYGAPRVSKIDAFNRDIEKAVTDWEILVIGQDDLKVYPGWDSIIRDAFKNGDLGRAKWFDTEPDEIFQNKSLYPHIFGMKKGSKNFLSQFICMHPVMGRDLYETIGFVFNPEYRSVYCDDEFTAVLREKKLIDYTKKRPFLHLHPTYRVEGAQNDQTYMDAFPDVSTDRKIFQTRQRKEFPGYNFNSMEEIKKKRGRPRKVEATPVPETQSEASTPKLSISIPSIFGREKTLNPLLKSLGLTPEVSEGMKIYKHPDLPVEVLVYLTAPQKSGGPSVPQKRQELLLESSGEYVCSIDDDDFVHENYLQSILNALEESPDCVGFFVDCVFGGKRYIAKCSNEYRDWSRELVLGKTIERTIHHLCPVRRQIALFVKGFEGLKQPNEDYHYSMRIKPYLKKQVFLSEKLYFYHK